MIKFFHIADIHLGVENYGKLDNKTGINTRLIDFQKTLSSIIDKAIEEKVDFLLFAGDAYKTAYPTPTEQKMLMVEFFKLLKANIPIIAIVGNHDHPLSFGKSNALEILNYIPLSGLYVFSNPDLIKIKTKNGYIQIIGVPWPTRSNLKIKESFKNKKNKDITQYLARHTAKKIKELHEKLDPNIPAILAGHLTVSSGIFSGSEKKAIFGNDPILYPQELALPGIDYVALGHLHRHQNLNPGKYPAIVYSGSIERIDFGERNDEKGYCVVSIDTTKQHKRCKYIFRKLKVRSMIQIDVNLENEANPTEKLLSEIKKVDITGNIIKITYTINYNDKDKVDTQALYNSCNNANYLTISKIINKTERKNARIKINVDMRIETLFTKYLELKKINENDKNRLLDKLKGICSTYDIS